VRRRHPRPVSDRSSRLVRRRLEQSVALLDGLGQHLGQLAMACDDRGTPLVSESTERRL